MKLRNTDNVNAEIISIKADAMSSEESKSISVFQLLSTKFSQLKLALLVTICVHLSQQLSGMPAILYYSTHFFTVSK